MTRLATIASDRGARVVALLDHRYVDIRRACMVERVAVQPPSSLLDLLADASSLTAVEQLIARIEDAPESDRERLCEQGVLCSGDPALKAPLKPGLIVCSGNTFAAHAREMRGAAAEHPGGFIKSGHTVIAPGEPIRLPASHPDCVDFEGELACVIGRACHNVAVDDAMACIAGYTLINDVSARDWVDEARRSGDMFFNTLGKQFPTFCPLGPCIATASQIAKPADIRLTTSVNGELMQSASLGELKFSIAQIIAFWSQWYELRPGDIVSLGSPPGVGAARTPPRYLRSGDTVTVSASGIGDLINPVANSSPRQERP